MAAVVDGCNVFGRAGAFESRVAQLPTSGVVAEADGEIVLVADCITHLAAVGPGDGEVYTAFREIAEQCRMEQLAVGADGATAVLRTVAVRQAGTRPCCGCLSSAAVRPR